MELEIIRKSKISQAQKDKYCMISPKVDIIEVESRMAVTRGWVDQ
jgi:hypothetical protein